MSYPVSGMVKNYKPTGYNDIKKPLIPHGCKFFFSNFLKFNI